MFVTVRAIGHEQIPEIRLEEIGEDGEEEREPIQRNTNYYTSYTDNLILIVAGLVLFVCLFIALYVTTSGFLNMPLMPLKLQ